MRHAYARLQWRNLWILASLSPLILAASAGQVRTNWVERWVTNSIEVTVPANRFVTEYHTNVVLHVTTNVVDVYATNLVTRQFTNLVVVDAFQTYFVRAWQTNYRTLNVTNWTTAVVLRTNWLHQTVTNVAEVDLPQTGAADINPRQTQTPSPAPPAVTAGALTIRANRGTRAAPANQADVRLVVSWKDGKEAPAPIKQWRVQSHEGSFLCFGQEPEFRRVLPYGLYKVEVKAQIDSQSPVVTARATLSVSARAVTVEQKALAQR